MKKEETKWNGEGLRMELTGREWRRDENGTKGKGMEKR